MTLSSNNFPAPPVYPSDQEHDHVSNTLGDSGLPFSAQGKTSVLSLRLTAHHVQYSDLTFRCMHQGNKCWNKSCCSIVCTHYVMSAPWWRQAGCKSWELGGWSTWLCCWSCDERFCPRAKTCMAFAMVSAILILYPRYLKKILPVGNWLIKRHGCSTTNFVDPVAERMHCCHIVGCQCSEETMEKSHCSTGMLRPEEKDIVPDICRI